MRNDTVQAVQLGILAILAWWVFVLMLTVDRIEKKLDVLQQTATVQDAPASGGGGA